MEIIDLNIKDLVFAEYNPRKLSPEQEKYLSDSLTRFGMVDPIIVNSNPDRMNIIVGGHQRCKVWKKLGNKTIPAYYVDLALDKERELNVRLNKNTGEFDADILKDLFSKDELFDWGFNEDELSDIFDDMNDSLDPNEETEGYNDALSFQEMTFTLSSEQMKAVKDKINYIKKKDHYKHIETFNNQNENGNALYCLVKDYSYGKA